jgi:uncharacterized protein YaiE (UPF0345 family)
MQNEKTLRFCTAIADNLNLVLGSLYSATVNFDTNSDSYVKLALVAGGNNSVKALIKIAPASPPASGKVDSLGLTQTVYTPHVASVLYDITTPFSAGTTEKERAIVDWQVISLGTHVDWYSETAAGTNIAVADFATATLRASVDNIDLRNGTLSNM